MVWIPSDEAIQVHESLYMKVLFPFSEFSNRDLEISIHSLLWAIISTRNGAFVIFLWDRNCEKFQWKISYCIVSIIQLKRNILTFLKLKYSSLTCWNETLFGAFSSLNCVSLMWCVRASLQSSLNLLPFVGGRLYGQITSLVMPQVKLCQKNACLIVSTWWAVFQAIHSTGVNEILNYSSHDAMHL